MQIEDTDDVRALLTGSGVSLESVATFSGVSYQAIAAKLRRAHLSAFDTLMIVRAVVALLDYRLSEAREALAGLTLQPEKQLLIDGEVMA